MASRAAFSFLLSIFLSSQPMRFIAAPVLDRARGTERPSDGVTERSIPATAPALTQAPIAIMVVERKHKLT